MVDGVEKNNKIVEKYVTNWPAEYCHQERHLTRWYPPPVGHNRQQTNAKFKIILKKLKHALIQNVCYSLVRLYILLLRQHIWPMEGGHDLSVVHKYMSISQKEYSHHDASKEIRVSWTLSMILSNVFNNVHRHKYCPHHLLAPHASLPR